MVSSNFSQQKSPTAKIIGLYFLGTIVPRKYMPTISAVGLFCCAKFEETSNEKVVNMSKLTKPHFRYISKHVNESGSQKSSKPILKFGTNQITFYYIKQHEDPWGKTKISR